MRICSVIHIAIDDFPRKVQSDAVSKDAGDGPCDTGGRWKRCPGPIASLRWSAREKQWKTSVTFGEYLNSGPILGLQQMKESFVACLVETIAAIEI